MVLGRPFAVAGTAFEAAVTARRQAGETIRANDLQSGALTDEVDLTGLAVGNPVTVEIPDGAATATFDIAARLDSIPDGDQTIEIVASATINSLLQTDGELLEMSGE